MINLLALLCVVGNALAAKFGQQKKRVMGIEPTYPAWKAGVLPLNYTRKIKNQRFLAIC